MVTTIPEAVTTIPAGTIRLLLTSISYRAKARKEMRRKPPVVPRRPPRPCCWTAPPGVGSIETLTPQKVRRVCTADSVSALASDPHTTDGATYPYIPYYNTRSVLTCTVSGVAVVSGIGAGRPGAGRRSSVSQAAQWLVVWVLYRWRWSEPNRRKSVCKVLCNVLWRGRYKIAFTEQNAL